MSKIKTLDQCMNIFEWFDDRHFEYAMQIWYTKADAEKRLSRVLPDMRRQAARLIELHRGFEDAYPEARLSA